MNRLVVGGWLIIGLLHALSAIQYSGFDPSIDPSECALVLSQNSDANLLAGVFPYAAPQTCITYDAVNQAYLDARKRIQVKVPEGDNWKHDQIASVGELLLDISAQLAKTYGMSVDDVEKGLPFIDTSKTLIREVCPAYLSDVQCHAGKYRRLDGLCNNLQNPTWGAANTPFTRLMAPHFADGMTHPRESVLGTSLPLPRIVSRTIHPDEGFHDHAGTVMVVAWGQFMDHDLTLTATPLDRFTKNEPEECCNRPPHLKHPYCMDVIIPEDDYFYQKFNIRCQDFVRSFPAPRPGCRLGSRTPFNTLTGVIDGNTVYGITDEFGRHLRSGYGGLLRMNPVFSEYGLKDLLPLKLDIPDEGCTRANSSEYCFEAGEIRVNEQLVLACMHTLMAREHNRLARELAKINPHWDDETLYQEARRIVIAEIQHITYNEFLPIILGKEVMEKFGLLLQKEGHWDGYDANINPNIIDAFSAAAFRFGHSLLPTAVERWSKAHKFIASKRLSDLIRRPYDLYRAGVMDEYLMGLMNQVAQAMDDSITQEVTNHLLKKPGARFGLDLVAFNMQRGREFGVPGYMAFRQFCGLPSTDDFQDLFGSMPNTTVHRYMQIFQHTMDVDLWSGGVSEKPLPGSMIGPTFACIIATQFSYLRRGDRFWYELPNQPSSFTPEQLQEIKKIKLSRVICDNTDLIDTIQVYPMVLPDYEINPRVACRSGILPSIDLTKWAEYGATPDDDNAGEEEDDKVEDERAAEEQDENVEEQKEGEESILSYTKAIFLTKLNRTAIFERIKDIKNGTIEKPRNSTVKFPETSFVVGTPRVDIKNSKVKPLKFNSSGNATILVAKKSGAEVNKIQKDKKTSGKIVFERRKRQAGDYYEDDYEHDYSAPKIQEADHEYDGEYEYVKESDLKNGKDYDSAERDVYDIHGYHQPSSGEQETTHWPPRPYLPAYSVKAGKGKSGPGFNSGRPVSFNYNRPQQQQQYRYNEANDEQLRPPPRKIHGYNGFKRHPGGATSTSQFTMNNRQNNNQNYNDEERSQPHNNNRDRHQQLNNNGDHHHHHFYDGLRETHINSPPGTPIETFSAKGPTKVHQKQSGKHKHFHHLKTPKITMPSIPSYKSPFEKEMTSSEEEEYFNPEEMTTKELEDIYKTYDDSDITSDIFPGQESKLSKSKVSKSKADVEKIMKKVRQYINKDDFPSLSGFAN